MVARLGVLIPPKVSPMKRAHTLVVGVVGLLGIAVLNAPSVAQCSDAYLTAPDGSELAQFGSVHVSNGRLFIGAPFADGVGQDAGAIYVFECTTGVWTLVQKTEPSDPQPNMGFGASLCALGGTLVASAVADSTIGLYSGAAYIFEYSAMNWQETQKLFASDAASQGAFGGPVVAQGNCLVLGAGYTIGSCSFAGKVYVFERMDSGWVEVAGLRPDSMVCGSGFGGAIDLEGNVIVSGSHNHDECTADNAGTTYVFENGSTGWSQTAKLCAPDEYPGDSFGVAVSISGDTILVGAPWTGPQQRGKVYVFDRRGAGWECVQTLLSPIAGYTSFGHAVQIQGHRALIGAPATIVPDGMGGVRKGAAWIFERTTSGWIPVRMLTADNGLYGDGFGNPVAFEGSIAAIGAIGRDVGGMQYAGAAYVFAIGLGERYCAAAVNSVGVGARLDASGSVSVAANDLRLFASPVPLRQTGIFYCGPSQAQVPFGNGWRCVDGALLRFPPRKAVGTVLLADLDNAAPPFAGLIVSGSRWNFQVWYRDPTGGGAYFNTTDALSILFEP